ncbi:unnamed protein product [Rotaria sp. Silwood1]|nr:unnamed protein product [Rotaria sp. Silwood1]CAF4686498.1 unnamed protein product [Rotaria sp. Silwood1]
MKSFEDAVNVTNEVMTTYSDDYLMHLEFGQTLNSVSYGAGEIDSSLLKKSQDLIEYGLSKAQTESEKYYAQRALIRNLFDQGNHFGKKVISELWFSEDNEPSKCQCNNSTCENCNTHQHQSKIKMNARKACKIYGDILNGERLSPQFLDLQRLHDMDSVLFKLFDHSDLSHCILCWVESKDIGLSHIVPKSVLEHQSKLFPYKNTDRLLLHSSNHPRYVSGTKKVKWKMLCSMCDNRFSTWENKFTEAFCNETSENIKRRTAIIRIHGATENQEVAYKEWLQSFLMSLGWRELVRRFATSSTNEYAGISANIMKLMHECRYHCTQEYEDPACRMLSLGCDRPPNVALIIAPTLCSSIAHYSNLLTRCLMSTLSASETGLPDGVILIKFGMFYILLMDDGKEWTELPERVRINREGSFVIPSDNERARFGDLPSWFIKHLTTAAERFEAKMNELRETTSSEKTERRQQVRENDTTGFLRESFLAQQRLLFEKPEITDNCLPTWFKHDIFESFSLTTILEGIFSVFDKQTLPYNEQYKILYTTDDISGIRTFGYVEIYIGERLILETVFKFPECCTQENFRNEIEVCVDGLDDAKKDKLIKYWTSKMPSSSPQEQTKTCITIQSTATMTTLPQEQYSTRLEIAADLFWKLITLPFDLDDFEN